MTKSRLFVAVLGALLISGCAARGVRIAELKDQPGKYDDKSVSVSGVVTRSWNVILLQLYDVDDGSGTITVLSGSGRTAPKNGAHVKVKGRISQVASFGSTSIGLHLREQDRKIN